MEYRQLGKSGVRVSPLCLGAMNFGGRTDEQDGVAIVHRAIDAGVNFIDTANVYTQGRSEQIVGTALKDRRDDVVLATKVHGRVGPGPNDRGNSRLSIMREVDRSLQRLSTDRIDLYQLHRWDAATPIEETMQTLHDLVSSGKVRYIGVSTFPAWVTARAQEIAIRSGFTPILTEQPPYNLLEREVEKDVLPVCQLYGMGVIPWSPLAGGLLADRFVGGELPEGARATMRLGDGGLPDTLREAIDKLAALVAEAGTTLSRFALAWLRDQPGVTAPIIGPRTMEQLEDAIASIDVVVDDAIRTAVDAIVPPMEGLWMRARQQAAARAQAASGSRGGEDAAGERTRRERSGPTRSAPGRRGPSGGPGGRKGPSKPTGRG